MDAAKSDEACPPMANDIFYIQGYLYKKTRVGRWQKRWFETTGCFLTYYKSKKMTKLLAALNLPQVGEIKLVTEPLPEDEADTGCLFSIHLNDRDYLLKAADATEAARWVEVLNQLKNGANAAAVSADQVQISNPIQGDVLPPVEKRGWQKNVRGCAVCAPCCATI